MWNHYRRLKPTASLLLAIAGVVLMSGQPDDSALGRVGVGMGAALLLAYVAEEIVWMARNQGRPCPKCGCLLGVKPFRLHLRCPDCGEVQ